MTFEGIEKFYQKDTVTIAKELLGKILISKNENEIFAGYIVETEAYLGEFDRAAHGYGKKRTPKVEALFEKAGTVYIHSIHSHKMLNIVTCEKGNPQSVLIRAIEPILNVERMEENRGKSGILVSNGPGKFTKAFGIDDRFYKTEVQIVEKNMFEIENFFEKLENKNFGIKYDISKINEKYLYLDFENAKIPKKIGTSARIGVPNKGVWTEKKLRFFVEGNRFVSGMRKADMKDDVWEWNIFIVIFVWKEIYKIEFESKGEYVKKNILKVLLFLVLANVGFGDAAQILGDYYSIDKGKVYYRNKILEGANPKTAELIGLSLLKDDNKIYYLNKKIENADIMSFKVLNEDYAKDKNYVYSGSEAIDSSLSEKIKDPKTFEFLPNGIINATLYGKDKYNVYYIENKMINCFDSYYFIYEVKGINKDKVEVLNDWFIKDDKNIYFKGKILESADYNTFEVLPNGDGKDKNRSYEYLTKKDEWKWF